LTFFSKKCWQELTNTPSPAEKLLAGTLLEMEYGYAKVEYKVRRGILSNPGRILHGGVSSLMLERCESEWQSLRWDQNI